MSTMDIVDPRLQWFVGRMRDKLALPKNQAKTDWRELNPEENIQAIRDEYDELTKAFQTAASGQDLEDVIDECADVANRAMMLADQCRPITKDNP